MSVDELVARVEVGPSPDPRAVAARIVAAWADHPVVHVSGLPTDTDLRTFYDQVVDATGLPVDVAEDARIRDRDRQKIGQRWMEVRFDPAIPDAYRHSSNAQPLHTDGSYIPDYPNATLMYCVSANQEGGETVFLDGGVLVGLLERLDPGLLERLRTTTVPHVRSGMERHLPVLDADDDGPLLNWNYYCVAPDVTAEVARLRDDLHTFLQRPEVVERLVPIALAPGESVVWKDQRLLHGRTSFVASDASDRFIWKCAVDVGRFATT